MKLHLFPVILFCAIALTACTSGDKAPEDAAEARELMTGAMWSVKDVGLLESSFREQKGQPFVHTIKWQGGAGDSTMNAFMKATLTLEVNATPGNESGNIAHLDGLNLGEKQQYYFTSTQEEDPDDRTIKLYVNCTDSAGGVMQYPFTILNANSKKVILLVPREIGPMNLVLALER